MLGAPLPLIQSTDFTPLSAANSWLQLAATDAGGRPINSVIYNSGGDAIFTVNTTPSIITPGTSSRMNFSGKCVVVGGRGKYAEATGEMDFAGFFNTQNPNDAGYNLNGWIEY